MDQADDLKAFERRLFEIVASLQPSIWRWRLILLILISTTIITFSLLIIDIPFFSPTNDRNNTKDEKTFLFSLFFRKGISFSLSLGLLISAFLFGIHRKIVASSTIIARLRSILNDYNMSCDDSGRLIIKPRPTANSSEEF